MTDLQIMALCFPIIMVVFVIAVVTIEELVNQSEMKRERAAARRAAPAGYTGSMTIDVELGDIAKLPNEIESSSKRRASEISGA
jgi:hypothetical protein